MTENIDKQVVAGFGDEWSRFERRFTKDEIRAMMGQAGLENIRFSEASFWTAVGYKKA